MENVYYTALYKVAKRLDFLLDFCIEKNRKKNLGVRIRITPKSCLALEVLKGTSQRLSRDTFIALFRGKVIFHSN